MIDEKFKILIIEDEEVLIDVLEKKLTYEGYEISVAKDGEEGLKKIKEVKPDIVLLDIVMPKMNGYEVLEVLQKDTKLAQIPVIIISNSGQPVEIDRALRLGAKDYLVKAEFSPEEVLEKVVSCLKDKVSISHHKDLSSNPQPQKILIVEDDQFLRELCVKKLEKEGFKATAAVDGSEGLKKLAVEAPDLILLDIILPGIDGFDVLKNVKEDPKLKDIPVILLTNLGQKDDVEKGLKLGARDYLIKAHFTPKEIIDKVKSVLEEEIKR